MLRFLLTAIVLHLAIGCASTDASKPSLNPVPKGKTFTEWNEYILDTGDVVSLQIEEMPQLNGIQKVSASGSIVLPTLGMVRAKGLTETQLREALTLKVRPHVKIPRVALSVLHMNSYMVYIEGKVAKPGAIKLEARTTLGQGITLAGGLNSGEIRRIIIVRDAADGSRKRYENSIQALKDGLMDNWILERGDQVILD